MFSIALKVSEGSKVRSPKAFFGVVLLSKGQTPKEKGKTSCLTLACRQP